MTKAVREMSKRWGIWRGKEIMDEQNVEESKCKLWLGGWGRVGWSGGEGESWTPVGSCAMTLGADMGKESPS